MLRENSYTWGNMEQVGKTHAKDFVLKIHEDVELLNETDDFFSKRKKVAKYRRDVQKRHKFSSQF